MSDLHCLPKSSLPDIPAGASGAPFHDASDEPLAWHIDAAALAAGLRAARDWQVEIVAETGSTNADLTRACREAAWSERVAVRVAYRQTAGRGRQGRPWQGQAGLMFSAALPFALPPARLGGLSLAVGLAIAEGLADYDAALGRAVELKWPNDLQIAGRKLAGILIEAIPAGPGKVWAVVGIGLNLVRNAAMEAALGRELAGVADCLPSFDPRHDSTGLLAAILNRLASMREAFLADGFAPMAARWSARDAYRDQPVRLLHDGNLIAEGMARGVDGDGQLMLETAAGLEAVCSGELSLRPAPDPGGQP